MTQSYPGDYAVVYDDCRTVRGNEKSLPPARNHTPAPVLPLRLKSHVFCHSGTALMVVRLFNENSESESMVHMLRRAKLMTFLDARKINQRRLDRIRRSMHVLNVILVRTQEGDRVHSWLSLLKGMQATLAGMGISQVRPSNQNAMHVRTLRLNRCFRTVHDDLLRVG